MNDRGSKAYYWSLSAAQLARECQSIAEDSSTNIDPELHAEARRLFAGWQESLALSEEDYDERARKASLQAGLRKRTIEILVKISGA